jgi:metallo-beta-lactamase family protein
MGNIPITHLGAKTCVTGSCHLIQIQPDHGSSIAILVNCGIVQGHILKIL